MSEYIFQFQGGFCMYLSYSFSDFSLNQVSEDLNRLDALADIRNLDSDDIIASEPKIGNTKGVKSKLTEKACPMDELGEVTSSDLGIGLSVPHGGSREYLFKNVHPFDPILSDPTDPILSDPDKPLAESIVSVLVDSLFKQTFMEKSDGCS